MDLRWIAENPARWDDAKAAVIGGVAPGSIRMPEHAPGDLLPGDWWRVEEDGRVAGYGWMDTNWGGDAEVLLAVRPEAQGRGVGAFILDRLVEEAAQRGVNYLYNEVPPSHPDPAGITGWLVARGFRTSHEGRLLRKAVPRRK